jgi:hypothetical protein
MLSLSFSAAWIKAGRISIKLTIRKNLNEIGHLFVFEVFIKQQIILGFI